MKNIAKFGIGCFAVILLIAGFGVFKYYSWKHETEKNVQQAGKYVLKALNIKYKKDFVIDKGHYIYNTGGYEFTVHPKGDPDFTFNAWLNGMTESGESDDYFMAQRFYGAIKMVRPYIDVISKDNYFSAAAVEPGNLPNYKEMVGAIHKHQYSVEQMLTEYPKKISIDLEIHINYNITPENENSVLKKVYNLIEFLKNKKFGYIRISLFFYNFPNESINEITNSNDNYLLKAKKRIVVTPDDIKNIKAPNDIRGYMKNIIRSIH